MDAIVILSEEFSDVQNYITNNEALPSKNVMNKSTNVFVQQKLKYLYNCVTKCHHKNVDLFGKTLQEQKIPLKLMEWHNKCPCKNK